jgi:hypothetical protein
MTIAPRPWIAALDPYVPGRPAVSDDGSLTSNEPALGAGYQTVPSQANFILVLPPNAGKLAEALALRGVNVRPGPALGVADAIRVGIPSQSGVALLKRALTSIGEHAAATRGLADPDAAPTPPIRNDQGAAGQ